MTIEPSQAEGLSSRGWSYEHGRNTILNTYNRLWRAQDIGSQGIAEQAGFTLSNG